MSQNKYTCVISPWGAADTAVSTTRSLLYGVVAKGSAANSVLTLQNSAAVGGSTVFVYDVIATTSIAVVFTPPILFSLGISVDLTGTASYAILYAQQPN